MNAARRFAALAVPVLLLLGQPAQAQQQEQGQGQQIEVGTNLVCDTEAQVEMFVALYDGDVQGAADRVNAEVANPTACVVTAMAYLRGPQLATARNKGMSYEIAQIIVLGVVTDSGLQPVNPSAYYSLFKVEGIEV